MRILRNSIQYISALAFSCILTVAVPAAAAGPHHDQTHAPKDNKHATSGTSHAKAGHHAGTSAKRRAIQARPTAESKTRRPTRTAQLPAPAPEPCVHPNVTIAPKKGEIEHLALTQCDGRPTHEALLAIDRWLGVAPKTTTTRTRRHASTQETAAPGRVALLARLQALATAFPDHELHLHEACNRDAGRAGHARAEAIDVEIDGVPIDKQLEVCRTLPDTACGQIDGQPFVHLEVRRAGSGHLFWFDATNATK